MDRKILEDTLGFWRSNGYPDSIMESQREYNRTAYEKSRKSVEEWISEMDSKTNQIK